MWQLLLPKKLREDVLHQLHDTVTSGHLGVGCHQEVQQWCKSCDVCATRKGPPKAVGAPMAHNTMSELPWRG